MIVSSYLPIFISGKVILSRFKISSLFSVFYVYFKLYIMDTVRYYYSTLFITTLLTQLYARIGMCGVSHCSQMHIVCTDLYICIMFLLFAKLGRNSNTVQSELSPIVQWMEFGPSPVTVLLN